jgi:predicted DCC family thiol-disulfide oxidoreductase YuxK
MTLPSKPVVLFDGICNLCNGSVQFVIKRDPQAKFLFASLQSAVGQAILKDFDLNTHDFASFILIDNGKVYTRSTAALRVAKELDSPIKYIQIFTIVPSFIRDLFYIFVAKNRYRFFGKQDQCMLPSSELKTRFLI